MNRTQENLDLSKENPILSVKKWDSPYSQILIWLGYSRELNRVIGSPDLLPTN